MTSWQEFLEECVPAVAELVADRSAAGQQRYLATLAAYACRLRSVPKAEFGRYPGYPKDCRFALTHRGEPFFAVQFELEPYAFMPYHPHPGGVVCTLLLEGAARVRNFEFVDTPDWARKGPVKVRNTRDELLLSGHVNLVAADADNIHGFRAGPDGARGIDLTTSWFPDRKQKDSILEIEDEPSSEGSVYSALWREKTTYRTSK